MIREVLSTIRFSWDLFYSWHTCVRFAPHAFQPPESRWIRSIRVQSCQVFPEIGHIFRRHHDAMPGALGVRLFYLGPLSKIGLNESTLNKIEIARQAGLKNETNAPVPSCVKVQPDCQILILWQEQREDVDNVKADC